MDVASAWIGVAGVPVRPAETNSSPWCSGEPGAGSASPTTSSSATRGDKSKTSEIESASSSGIDGSAATGSTEHSRDRNRQSRFQVDLNDNMNC